MMEKKIHELDWNKEKVPNPAYAGKYVTHDDFYQEKLVDHIENSYDLEIGQHTLEYEGTSMNVDLRVNDRWAVFLYDKTFEEELGDKEFGDVLAYFIIPDQFKYTVGLEGE